MKKLSILLLICVANLAYAQSTEILPGVVLPLITTAQRNAMANPADGTLVFDKTTQSYWYRRNNAWAELLGAGSASSYWKLAGIGGNEIQNTNTGGFWSKNPTGLQVFSNDSNNPPTVPVNEAGTRLMWIPNRSAFRVGSIDDAAKWSADSVALFSFAAGFNATARGMFSTSIGQGTVALGYNSVALGKENIAKGLISVALGYQTKAIGDISTALNSHTEASGENAFATGYLTIARGSKSSSFGVATIASGGYSTSMGLSTEASGDGSVAMGQATKASGGHSLATGLGSIASGNRSTAMGNSTVASGEESMAIGQLTEAKGSASFASGFRTIAAGDNTTAMGYKVNTNNFKGAFMIGDSDPDNEGATLGGAADQFVARFKNGYYLMTSGNANPRTGVTIANGQTAWSAISDSTRKERFLKANGEAFLTKLSHLRLGSWNYKGRGAKAERFYGPMAQEIFAAFGKDSYGTIGTDTTVSTINMDGLLFIFSQALEKRTAELQNKTNILQADNRKLNTENAQLKAILQKFEARLENLEEGRNTSSTTETSKK